MTIRINGQNIPAQTYIAGLRLAKAMPTCLFLHGLKSNRPVSGAQVTIRF